MNYRRAPCGKKYVSDENISSDDLQQRIQYCNNVCKITPCILDRNQEDFEEDFEDE